MMEGFWCCVGGVFDCEEEEDVVEDLLDEFEEEFECEVDDDLCSVLLFVEMLDFSYVIDVDGVEFEIVSGVDVMDLVFF